MPAPDVSDKSLAQLISLKGRVAVITGGARGLGLAIGRRLAEAGAAIVLGDLDGGEAERAAAAVARDHGVRAKGYETDVTDSASVRTLADYAVSEFGGIDIWVNNAGIYPVTPLMDLSEDEWDQVNDVNLRGTFLGCREAARRMLPAGSGAIINIESMAAFRGRAGCVHYAASKHGVHGITQSLAVELGPQGVRVVSIAPTLNETPGVHQRRAEAAGSGGEMTTSLEEKVIAAIPLRRTGQPDDVARIALFLASDLAAFVTGTTVFADGGHSAF